MSASTDLVNTECEPGVEDCNYTEQVDFVELNLLSGLPTEIALGLKSISLIGVSLFLFS